MMKNLNAFFIVMITMILSTSVMAQSIHEDDVILEKVFLQSNSQIVIHNRKKLIDLTEFVKKNELFENLRKKSGSSALTNDERQIIREAWAGLLYHNLQLNHVINNVSNREETLKDDFTSQDEQIITNLIHLEIETIDNEEFITHIDHEFILYTLDEYENKTTSYSKKGSKKIKTFKIDNSRIPLKYNYKDTPILIYFIMELLDHKELIAEYFSKIYKR